MGLRQKLSLNVFIAALILLIPTSVAAQSYNVSASVPFPPPNLAATIDNQLAGSIVSQALLTIGGTCEVINPYTVVSIWRGGSPIGSTTCQPSGRFNLDVLLVVGSNSLIARSASVSSLYGPDSSIFNITFVPPVTPPPPTAGPQATTTTETQRRDDLNRGAISGLTAATTEPFSVLSNENTTTITVTVGGGTTPYTITINWGDGTIETRTVATAGQYQFTHTYEKPGAYRIKGEVKDTLGATTEFIHSVVPTTIPPSEDAPTDTDAQPQDGQSPSLIWPMIIFVSSLLLVGLGYILGAKRRRKKNQETPPKRAVRKKKK